MGFTSVPLSDSSKDCSLLNSSDKAFKNVSEN